MLPSLDEIKEGLTNAPWWMAGRAAAHLAASVQLALGHVDTANNLLTHLLQATVSELGPKSFEAVAIRSRLAGLLWLKGEIAAAEREFASIAAFTAADGLDDPVLRGNALNSRGVCLRDLGRLAESESALNEALSIRLTTGGPDASVVADTRMNLAGLYVRSGRGSEALAAAAEVARIRKVRGQWTPPKESETRAMIGRALMLKDGPAAGLEELKQAWQVRFDSGLLTNWQTNIAVDGLLEALIALGRIDEATQIAEREHAKLLETAGAENSATKLAARRLERLASGVTMTPD